MHFAMSYLKPLIDHRRLVLLGGTLGCEHGSKVRPNCNVSTLVTQLLPRCRIWNQ